MRVRVLMTALAAAVSALEATAQTPPASKLLAVRAARLLDVKTGRIVTPGWAIRSTGGHCDITGFVSGVLETTFREGVGDGPDELVKAVRYQSKHGGRAIKICATAGVLSMDASVGATQLSDAELRATSMKRDAKVSRLPHMPTAPLASSPPRAQASHPSNTVRSSTTKPSAC